MPAAAAKIEAAAPRQPLTAWTRYDELTPDQRERFGDYVKAKEKALAELAAQRRGTEAAKAAMIATGGNKAAALALLLAKG